MMSSSIVHAESVWDKDISQFTTSLTLEQGSNIYHRARKPEAESAYRLALTNESISLFEGYGVALPFSVSHVVHSNMANLDHTAYKLSPSLQVFFSPDTTLMLKSGVTKEQLISGSTGAELFESTFETLNKIQHQLIATLQIGKPPQQNSFAINVEYLARKTVSQNTYLTNESRQISSRYGYRISEDSYAQVSGSYAWQQTNQLMSRRAEAGLGFITTVGGSHELNVILGTYRRIDRQQTGMFWTISDHLRISDLLTLSFTTPNARY